MATEDLDTGRLEISNVRHWNKYRWNPRLLRPQPRFDWRHGGVWNPFEGTLRVSKAESGRGMGCLLVIEFNHEGRIPVYHDIGLHADTNLVAHIGGERIDLDHSACGPGKCGMIGGYYRVIARRGGSPGDLIAALEAADEAWIAETDGDGGQSSISHFETRGPLDFGGLPVKGA